MLQRPVELAQYTAGAFRTACGRLGISWPQRGVGIPASAAIGSWRRVRSALPNMACGQGRDDGRLRTAQRRGSRRTLPARLLEWRPADGWAPLAERLGVPVPDEPFPCANTRAQFRVPEFGTMAEWAQAR